MSDDLAHQGRSVGRDLNNGLPVTLERCHTIEQMADRIEELEAENERLRLALEETVSLLWDDMSKQESVGKNGGYIYMKCRAALKELTGDKDER
jgi:hypothetical protein